MSERPSDALALARALRERAEKDRRVWDYIAARLDQAIGALDSPAATHTHIEDEVRAIARHYAPELLGGNRD